MAEKSERGWLEELGQKVGGQGKEYKLEKVFVEVKE